jgi:hypothetical protein
MSMPCKDLMHNSRDTRKILSVDNLGSPCAIGALELSEYIHVLM